MDRHEIRQWLNEHLKGLYPEPVEASVVDGELLIMGRLAVDAEVSEDEARNRINKHREESRPQREKLAQELQQLTGLAVAWGVRCGQGTGYFSSLRVPVMTRLGRAERDVLDTLIRGGIARNRSQAVNWAIQAFAHGHRDWLSQLREAANNLSKVQEQAPDAEAFGGEEAPPVDRPNRPQATSGHIMTA
ncbi:MAG: hypothetical protein EXR53_03485 [Dehalococcoidia bacterium]|nr:hypothetical protein [Dehalococcoidia bacterium]